MPGASLCWPPWRRSPVPSRGGERRGSIRRLRCGSTDGNSFPDEPLLIAQLEHRMRDHLHFAVRSLRRAPGFATAALALLALGIGATTAVFSVAAAVLIRPLPIREQGRVIALWATGAGVTSEVPTLLDRYERFRRSTKT